MYSFLSLQSLCASLVRKFKGPSEGYRSSYSPVNFWDCIFLFWIYLVNSLRIISDKRWASCRKNAEKSLFRRPSGQPLWCFLDMEHSTEICNSCSNYPSMNLVFHILLFRRRRRRKRKKIKQESLGWHLKGNNALYWS